MRYLLTAMILLLCVVSHSHAAKFDTSFDYSTVETDHFSIHFHQGLEEAAQKTAVIAEDVHAKLIKEFNWTPDGKTQVVLIDDSDFTNGFAVTIPYNTIYLQIVPPSIASTLGEYDDWIRVLFTHEYAHILSSDAARGYSKVTRSIFGKPLPWIDPLTGLFFLVTAPPNTFMPRWWHEGMATWAETKYTGQGRGKGTFYDMVFRTAVAEDNLPSVDQINGDVPYWPGGSHPYMYGYRLQRYIAETYGEDAAGRLTTEHAGRFPYLINAPVQRVTGYNSYRNVYAEMLVSLGKEQTQRIAALSTSPFTPITTLNAGGENLTYPRYSPDGTRIAFTRRDPHEHTYVIITDAAGREVDRFRRQYSEGSLSWSPDGSRIFFTQAEVERGFNIYQDLYSYDLKERKVTRMTKGERVSEVQVAPDETRFLAVVSNRGSQNLAIIEGVGNAKKAKARPITAYSLQRVSSPRWSPDGRTVCYILTDNKGRSTLRLNEPATGTDRPVFGAEHTLAYPAWSPDGSVIYYISDQTGVFNVFAHDLKVQKSFQVSHLLTGALQPEPSPDGKSLLVAHYTSRGFRIGQMNNDRSTWKSETGPSLALTRAAALRVATATAQAPAALPASDYSALKTLLPRFWLPRFYDDGGDGVAIGAFTAGADALGYNAYAVSAAYGTDLQKGYYSLIYQNDYFYPTLLVRAHSEPFLYSNIFQTGYDYYELNRAWAVEAIVPINFLESNYRIRAGYEFVDQEALTTLSPTGTLRGVPIFQGRRDNLFAGITYDSALKYPYSISSEEGRTVSFLYRRYDRGFGSDIDLSEYRGSYEQYLRPSPKKLPHHVLYLRLAGAIADGDLQYGQQAFQLGGPPSEYNDFPLRGYPVRSFAGRYAATGTLEYRLPLTYPMRGPGTVPAFLEKVHSAAFVDAGQVWDDRIGFHSDETRVGAGVEVRADLTLGYWAKVTPALGFARGFNRNGEKQLYFTLYLDL